MATGTDTTSTSTPASRPGTRRNARGSGRAATTREGGATGAARGGRARGAAARPATRPTRARRQEPEDRYDLLTAALIGAAFGATAMLLVRRPASRKVVRPLAELGVGRAGRMALEAGAGALGARAMRQAGKAAMPMVRDAAENLGDYVRTARSAIDDFLAEEVRDLRKAIRRGRRRAGL